MKKTSCFIMGLPSAGKTTFLAALAFSLQQNKSKTMLHWREFTGNHQYLTRLAEKWLTAEPVERTRTADQKSELTIDLCDDDGNQWCISFPDLSGEIFQYMYKDREIDIELSDKILSSDGVLLFINPLEIHEPTLISTLNMETHEYELTDTHNLNVRNSIDDDPTEVQLVELLQFISGLKNNQKVNLSVIISAWDVARTEYSTPEAFTKSRAPLLWQYLFSNTVIYDYTFYGISAQGGDLGNEGVAQGLLENYVNNPCERIIVIDNDGNASHDITLPLWNMMQ